MTERTALYRIYDGEDELLYVGISKHFGTRWTAHAKTQSWWLLATRQTIVWFETREEADEAETKAISTERPRFNTRKTGSRQRSRARPSTAPQESAPVVVKPSRLTISFEGAPLTVSANDLEDGPASPYAPSGVLVFNGFLTGRAARKVLWPDRSPSCWEIWEEADAETVAQRNRDFAAMVHGRR